MLQKTMTLLFAIASLGMVAFVSAEPVEQGGAESVQSEVETGQVAKPVASPAAAASSSASSAEPAEVLKTKTRSNQSND